MTVAYILFIILAILVIYVIAVINEFIRLKNKVKHSKSSIDVYLVQRFDLIPNLTECVKSYMNYEKETLTTIASLREHYMKDKNIGTAQELTNTMNGLIARAEGVTELKANEQFQVLEKSLIKIESQLQAARRIYNGDVTLYNTSIQSFPNAIVAGLFGFKEEELFTIEEYKAQNIDIKKQMHEVN